MASPAPRPQEAHGRGEGATLRNVTHQSGKRTPPTWETDPAKEGNGPCKKGNGPCKEGNGPCQRGNGPRRARARQSLKQQVKARRRSAGGVCYGLGGSRFWASLGNSKGEDKACQVVMSRNTLGRSRNTQGGGEGLRPSGAFNLNAKVSVMDSGLLDGKGAWTPMGKELPSPRSSGG